MPEVHTTMTALEWCFEHELSHIPGWRSESLETDHPHDTRQTLESDADKAVEESMLLDE